MSERVRVNNVTPYAIGLKSQNGIEYNIRPKAFVMMNRDDVEYSMAVAPKLFASPAQLLVEDMELNEIIGVNPVEENNCDPEEIAKYLKGAAGKLDAWLSENNKPHIIESVYAIAMEMDLPSSKIKVLQKYMPNRDLIED